MPIYKIIKCEPKTTSNGKLLKKVTIQDVEGNETENVAIWSNYPNFQIIDDGYTTEGTLEVTVNGKFENKTLKPLLTNTLYPKKTGIKAAQERKAEMIEKAQERKNESIAYFNALNAAINLVVQLTKTSEVPFSTDRDLKDAIVQWREWFLSEWEKYDAKDVTEKTVPF